jgi:hypothetical protein
VDSKATFRGGATHLDGTALPAEYGSLAFAGEEIHASWSHFRTKNLGIALNYLACSMHEYLKLRTRPWSRQVDY